MKKPILLTVLIFSCCLLKAQVTTHHLLFKPGQLTLTPEQQEEIKKLALRMKHGENLTIYPLTGDDPEARFYSPKQRISRRKKWPRLPKARVSK